MRPVACMRPAADSAIMTLGTRSIRPSPAAAGTALIRRGHAGKAMAGWEWPSARKRRARQQRGAGRPASGRSSPAREDGARKACARASLYGMIRCITREVSHPLSGGSEGAHPAQCIPEGGARCLLPPGSSPTPVTRVHFCVRVVARHVRGLAAATRGPARFGRPVQPLKSA